MYAFGIALELSSYQLVAQSSSCRRGQLQWGQLARRRRVGHYHHSHCVLMVFQSQQWLLQSCLPLSWISSSLAPQPALRLQPRLPPPLTSANHRALSNRTVSQGVQAACRTLPEPYCHGSFSVCPRSGLRCCRRCKRSLEANRPFTRLRA